MSERAKAQRRASDWLAICIGAWGWALSMAATSLGHACATPPPPVAALPDPPACPADAPTVLFGHEVDTHTDAVLTCRLFAGEGTLLCIPYNEEIEQ